MIYSILFEPSADRDLEHIPKSSRSRVLKKISNLAENPRPRGVEKIKGRDNRWRIRVGNYRIIYEIKDDCLLILVIRIGHRREIYRKSLLSNKK